MTEPRHDRTPDATVTDTRAAGVPAVPPGVLDLLAAIRDAVNVPLPTIDPADERAWHDLMQRRLGDLHAVLATALRPEWADILDPAREADAIRARLAAAPVAYGLYVQGGGAR